MAVDSSEMSSRRGEREGTCEREALKLPADRESGSGIGEAREADALEQLI